MSLKILFLSHSFYPNLGGIEANSAILATEFKKAGHEVHLLTWSKDVQKTRFPFCIIRNPSLRQLFHHHRWADVVFENNPCFRLGWPAIFFNRPGVIAIRTWLRRTDGRLSFRDWLKIHWWIRRNREVIAVSDAVRAACYPRATVIPNPYNVEYFKILTDVERSTDFVFLGRLVSDKGADQAILALQKLNNYGNVKYRCSKRFTLTIVGDGPDRYHLEQYVVALGLQDDVIFTGSLTGKSLCRCLNQHRFILIPSVWEEPFGNVVLEGMACGCIPISSDGGGLPEAVGKAGLIYNRRDVDSLVATIMNVIGNPVLQQQLMIAAAVQLIDHRPEHVSERYLWHIEKAFKSCRGKTTPDIFQAAFF